MKYAVFWLSKKKTPNFTFFGCKIGCKSRKSLIMKRCCGERGRRYQVTILRNSLILNSCTSQNFIFFALLWRRTGARQNAPNH